MLQDVGHKLCPSPILGEKKGSKTKKQMAACEDYQTMLSLYNKGSSMLLRMGSLSAEHVKDFKQGLPEVLMDEQFPAKFENLIKLDANDLDNYAVTVSLLRKRAVFHSYETMRLDTSVHVQDSESIRINPLTGEKVLRISPSTSDLLQPPPPPAPRRKPLLFLDFGKLVPLENDTNQK
ncbi:hypothetical protein TELCIR_22440 [Teladorsagia circumcincta]|uniref:Uncharacterized protein n=1 Tax=Teladorsagia circumcincta TaxID=45464 RepID=A0A2G9TDY4_TELCI|nr:hypothetical protein TELCIR_22440 [Teladorsagia circumcincta]